jgi:beta-aspartyl-peptidase (threonine type)
MTAGRDPVLIVHGGAWDIPAKLHAAHRAGMLAGLAAGRQVLEQGGSALDAVEAAVRVMEEDPVFDAGRGSCLNTDGSVEMDASIMDGRDLSAGAVAALRNFLHPTSVARRVMEETEHILLAGEGAVAFARSAGFEPVDSMELLTEREQERLRALRRDHGFRTPHAFGAEREDGDVGGSTKRGTVGAVARDCRGDIAAATSTGGTPKKIPGRVGDSALIGSGTFADNRAGGVSATGWGESIIRTGTARTVIERLQAGDSADDAARFAVAELGRLEEKGLGGVIVIDSKGAFAAEYNTPNMARAWWTPGMAEPFVAV